MVSKWQLLAIGALMFTTANAAYNLVIDDQIIAKVSQQHGDYAAKRMRAWKKLIDEYKHLPELKKLHLVNRFFNQFDFVTDMSKWGKSDYWATPIEFVAEKAGDCEDFSLAKYFTLLSLGVDDTKLQLTYVKALELNEAHMVLTYYAEPDSEPLVLDNLVGSILPGSQRTDLLPIYSFNADGLWKAKLTGLGKRLGDSSHMDNWADLNQRMLQGM